MLRTIINCKTIKPTKTTAQHPNKGILRSGNYVSNGIWATQKAFEPKLSRKLTTREMNPEVREFERIMAVTPEHEKAKVTEELKISGDMIVVRLESKNHKAWINTKLLKLIAQSIPSASLMIAGEIKPVIFAKEGDKIASGVVMPVLVN